MLSIKPKTSASLTDWTVIKRDGRPQVIDIEKIRKRILLLGSDLKVDLKKIIDKTVSGLMNNIRTTELDRLACETAAYHSSDDPDYDVLAVRIAISNLHKNTKSTFLEAMELQYGFENPVTKLHCPQISEETLEITRKYSKELEAAIVYERDYEYTFFGLRTLERSYLRQQRGEIVERIQHMIMRYVIGIHGDDLPAILESYDLISRRILTHATPTIFNAGTPNPQMSSCFLLSVWDSIDSIYDTLKKCALLSKGAGGIGLSVSRVRAFGSYIRGTDGRSNGLVPMLRNFNETARYVDQCFVPETKIYIRHKGFIDICNVSVGDEVIGKSCQFQKVTKVIKHEIDDSTAMRRISTNQSSELVTDEHQLLSLRLTESVRQLLLDPDGKFKVTLDKWENVIKPRLKSNLLSLEWLTVSELDTNCFIASPQNLPNYLHPETFTYTAPIFHFGDYYFSQIESNETIKPSELNITTVYDLEVEEDESYAVHIGIAHNGGGKRKGAFAVFLEPWHADIENFLELKLNTGQESQRCRDLYYGLWVPDLFYERVEEDGSWSLFCPNEAPGLVDAYGSEFNALYKEYESRPGLAKKVMPARALMAMICNTQIETAMPYMCNKDPCNMKSNQKHLGTITNSNLCTEIIQYNDESEVAVCNLATVALPMFHNETKPWAFDFELLNKVVRIATRNLNRVIDRNLYLLPESKKSNLKHRNVGIGVQGLHDLFQMMHCAYASDTAKELNKKIFATMYYAALDESCELAKVDGPHESYPNSPVSKGILQYDMWNIEPDPMWPWDELKEKIARYGIRNSLLISLPPTASTSQIMGNSESFEPYTSNIYVRTVLSGSYVIVNKNLVRDLTRMGLWNSEMKQLLIAYKGSVQYIPSIPDNIKEIYKTAWEISNKDLIDMARDRSPYICQSHGLNVFIKDPTVGKFSALHNYARNQGLKTGMYYGHSRPAVDGIAFTVDHKLQQEAMEKMAEQIYPDKSQVLEKSEVKEESEPKRLRLDTDAVTDKQLEELENFVCVKGSNCLSCQ